MSRASAWSSFASRNRFRPRLALQNFGFFRNVYFAYIMNRNGRVAIFESGPNEVNGWGYDDVVGTAPQTFQSPKAIQPDHTFLAGGVWIAHEGPINVQDQSAGSPGVAALSNMVVNSAIQGVLPLNVQRLQNIATNNKNTIWEQQ